MIIDQLVEIILFSVIVIIFFGVFIFYIINAVTFFKQLSYKKNNHPDFKPGKYKQSQVIFIIFSILYALYIMVALGAAMLLDAFLKFFKY